MKKLFAIMVAVMALVAFSAPAFAADVPGPSVVVGARIWQDLGYQNLSKELTVNKKDDVTTAFTNLTASSYLNVLFTSPDKTTGAKVELGLSSKIGNAEAASLRYAYGWWKVGNCKLVAGHDDSRLGSLAYAPLQGLGAGQSAKLLMSEWGYIYSSRQPMVRFEYMAGNFGFTIAAVQPAAQIVPALPTGTDAYANLPRFDVTVEMAAGGFKASPAFGYSQIKAQGVTAGFDDSVTSWIALLPVKFSTGPFTVKANVFTGNNTDQEWDGGLSAGLGALPKSIAIWSAGKVKDTKATGGFLSAEYKIGQFTLAAGYGLVKSENDVWKKPVYQNEDYTRNMWFVSFPYQVTKNFIIHPEVAYWNYGDSVTTGKDNGNEWMMGLAFKFIF